MDPNSHVGSDSPPPRATILGSFLRGRPRNSSQSHISSDPPHDLPPLPLTQPLSPSANHRRRTAAAPSIHSSTSQNGTINTGLALSNMLRRRRSAGAIAAPGSSSAPAPTASTTGIRPLTSPGVSHRIRLVPHIDSRRSLRFDAIGRDIKEGDPALRIGRFTDRTGLGLAAVNSISSNKLAFKSKVVSRAHAEIWVESGGRFFVRDTKSSSGTFLNHVRLSPANTESRPFQIKDGDILQLGVDYQGGTEDIYKSVKIRIEVGREWQAAANAFNTNALKNLKNLAVGISLNKPLPGTVVKTAPKSSIPDCCICLFAITIRQALFVAPCSHTFHYKCIRPLLESHHPAFSCPLCRTFADLEEDVEVEVESAEDEDSAVEDASGGEASGLAVAQILNRPSAAVASHREPDRDVGAETDVEADRDSTGLARLRRVRLSQPRMMTLVDMSEPNLEEDGEDAEMVDVDLRAEPAALTVDAIVDVNMGVADAELAEMMNTRDNEDSGNSSGEMEAALVRDTGGPSDAEFGARDGREGPDGTLDGRTR